jgi:hypothetical protein
VRSLASPIRGWAVEAAAVDSVEGHEHGLPGPDCEDAAEVPGGVGLG